MVPFSGDMLFLGGEGKRHHQPQPKQTQRTKLELVSHHGVRGNASNKPNWQQQKPNVKRQKSDSDDEWS